MVNLEEITKSDDGFYVKSSPEKDAAYYSLRIALEAYFSTYYTTKSELERIACVTNHEEINKAIENNAAFIENSINIWMHLQHFFELKIKQILNEKNEFLTIIPAKDSKTYCYQVLMKQIEEREHHTNSVEFSEAKKRLNVLVSDNLIDSKLAKVFYENTKTLDFINIMRNMTTHRGRRILKYCTLDDVMCQHILPFLKEVLSCEECSTHNCMFGREKVTEIIQPLIEEGKKNNLDYGLIAYKKECARCTPRKKLMFGRKLSYWDKKEIEYKKEIYQLTENFVEQELKTCPCCSKRALLVSAEPEDITKRLEDCSFKDTGCYCALCGFEANQFILNYFKR